MPIPLRPRWLSPLALAALMLVAAAQPARADATAFVGVSSTPHNHSARGFSAGIGLLFLGFEFEYSHIAEDELEALPSLKTWSGNVLAQTPVEIAGITFYGTAGAGGYRETLIDRQDTSAQINVGGGAKIKLVGPVRVRVDYRVFTLKGSPLYSTYQRFYVGANLKF